MSDRVLLVCSCGEAHAPDPPQPGRFGTPRFPYMADQTGPGGDWRAAHHAEGHRVWLDTNRADCSPPQGCRRCGKPPAGRFQFYCGPDCRREFEANHFYGTARWAALYERIEIAGDGTLQTFEQRLCVRADDTCEGITEPNHIQPLNGIRPSFGCEHHQDGLEALCHSHHVRETKAQRRDGRIGTPESAAALRANDERRRAAEERRHALEAMNPRMM